MKSVVKKKRTINRYRSSLLDKWLISHAYRVKEPGWVKEAEEYMASQGFPVLPNHYITGRKGQLRKRLIVARREATRAANKTALVAIPRVPAAPVVVDPAKQVPTQNGHVYVDQGVHLLIQNPGHFVMSTKDAVVDIIMKCGRPLTLVEIEPMLRTYAYVMSGAALMGPIVQKVE
jgi:hypothetical protein